jgi:hypothetical protein
MEPKHTFEVRNLDILKYPRTPHLEGSRLQPGDEGFNQVPYAELAGRFIVVEEKLDGGNAGLSFSGGGELLLQSRGHYLTGGGRERQFNLFKHWAAAHEQALLSCLEDRYLMYGEWMHKLHSVFYDALPHYFCEFDVWDRSRECFLSTDAREALLADVPVLGVPVLYAGTAPRRLADLVAMVRPSLARTAHWRQAFEQTVLRERLDLDRAWQHANHSDLSEGLYIKVEEDGRTVARFKWVRADFVQSILESDKHHAEQPFIPNLLADGVDLYGPRLTRTWGDGRRNERR